MGAPPARAPSEPSYALAAVRVAALVRDSLFLVLGLYAGVRRNYVEALRERADRLERERELEARAAVDAIRRTGKAAMTELRRLLGVLRSDGVADDRQPQPDLDRIEELVARMRDAGLPVAFRREGEARPVGEGVSLAAYRIVQEALTNTLRHAGQVATEVAGHGLVGMRERAALFGGTVKAGPRPGGWSRPTWPSSASRWTSRARPSSWSSATWSSAGCWRRPSAPKASGTTSATAPSARRCSPSRAAASCWPGASWPPPGGHGRGRCRLGAVHGPAAVADQVGPGPGGRSAAVVVAVLRGRDRRPGGRTGVGLGALVRGAGLAVVLLALWAGILEPLLVGVLGGDALGFGAAGPPSAAVFPLCLAAVLAAAGAALARRDATLS